MSHQSQQKRLETLDNGTQDHNGPTAKPATFKNASICVTYFFLGLNTLFLPLEQKRVNTCLNVVYCVHMDNDDEAS